MAPDPLTPNEKRGRGRPPLPPEEVGVDKSVRLPRKLWDLLYAEPDGPTKALKRILGAYFNRKQQ